MPNPNQTDGKDRQPDRNKPAPKTDDGAIPSPFTRDPAEGSRETVQRNLDKKPS